MSLQAHSTAQTKALQIHAAFIGCAGIPNRYGGFEAFAEFCGPVLAQRLASVTVTGDASLYDDHEPSYLGVKRSFLKVRANGGMSILHDLVAFFSVYRHATHIVVLGVSGGPWFPLFRLMCTLGGKKLLVNIDGVEWRRTKFGLGKRLLLRAFDALAQNFSHTIIYDNPALRPFVFKHARSKAAEIAYPGDYVQRLPHVEQKTGKALTICRIEPENNIDMLIDGFLRSGLDTYTIVGNWDHGSYGQQLRQQHAENPRLRLLPPIYDPLTLAELRESCSVYIHGHSVGGTNPSLVEMLFYDCELCCFDVPFHRATAGTCARYFSNANELAGLLNSPSKDRNMQDRQVRRASYSRDNIAAQYIQAMIGS